MLMLVYPPLPPPFPLSLQVLTTGAMLAMTSC